jgi:2,4-dienoyl-CoA reductase-like NADH-dependent reductase (Old Yellow Enzyme family)
MTDRLVRPLALPCGVTLSNRLCKAAMSEGMADVNNNATPRLEALYRRWAVSGAGLLFSGNIQVDPDHLERPLNVVIHDESGQEQLARLAAAGRSGGRSSGPSSAIPAAKSTLPSTRRRLRPRWSKSTSCAAPASISRNRGR